MPNIAAYRHARLMQDFQRAGVTLQDLARALAALGGVDDGKLAQFDLERDRGEVTTGVYVDCIVKTEIMVERAVGFALARRSARREA